VKGNDDIKDGRALPSNRRRGFFIAFALLALLFIFVIVDTYLYQQNQPTNNPADLVSFVCRSSSSNQTFTIDVDVNLTDNMNQDEAIRVALEAYVRSVSLHVNPSASFSATTLECVNGIWLVEFDMAYPISSYCAQRLHVMTRVKREKFLALINPFVHTVEYARA